jgi:hypothetical protein
MSKQSRRYTCKVCGRRGRRNKLDRNLLPVCPDCIADRMEFDPEHRRKLRMIFEVFGGEQGKGEG